MAIKRTLPQEIVNPRLERATYRQAVPDFSAIEGLGRKLIGSWKSEQNKQKNKAEAEQDALTRYENNRDAAIQGGAYKGWKKDDSGEWVYTAPNFQHSTVGQRQAALDSATISAVGQAREIATNRAREIFDNQDLTYEQKVEQFAAARAGIHKSLEQFPEAAQNFQSWSIRAAEKLAAQELSHQEAVEEVSTIKRTNLAMDDALNRMNFVAGTEEDILPLRKEYEDGLLILSEFPLKTGIMKEDVPTLMKEFDQSLAAASIQNQIAKGLAEGAYSESQIAELEMGLTHLADGSDEEVINIRSHPQVNDYDDWSNETNKELKVKNIRSLLKDDKMAEDLARQTGRVISQYKQDISQYRDKKKFLEDMAGLTGVDRLSKKNQTTYNGLMEEAVKNGALDTLEGVGQIKIGAFHTKSLAPAVVAGMIDRLDGGTPAQVLMMAKLWKEMRSTINEEGVHVGNLLRNTSGFSETDQLKLDAAVAMMEVTGENFAEGFSEVMKRIASDSQGRYSIQGAIAQFNETKNYSDELSKFWLEESGAPNHMKVMPPSLKEKFEASFRANYIATQNAETAFNRAKTDTMARTVIHPMFKLGFTEQGMGGLQDPPDMPNLYEKLDGTSVITNKYGKFFTVTDYTQTVLKNLFIGGNLITPDGISPENFENAFSHENFLGTQMAMQLNPVTQVMEWTFRTLTPANRLAGEQSGQQFVLQRTADGASYHISWRDPNGIFHPLQAIPKAGEKPVPLLIDLTRQVTLSKRRLELEGEIDAFRNTAATRSSLAKQDMLTKFDEYRKALGRGTDPSKPYGGRPETMEEMLEAGGPEADAVKKMLDLNAETLNGIRTQMQKDLKEKQLDLEKIEEENKRNRFDFSKLDEDDSYKTSAYSIPDLMEMGDKGPESLISTIQHSERHWPDGTQGNLLYNFMLAESNLGRAPGTYRVSTGSDKGPMQINTGKHGAYREVLRRYNLGGDFAKKMDSYSDYIGFDLANATEMDMNRPMVNVAYARLYLSTIPMPNPGPEDPEAQAKFYKDHWNSHSPYARGTEAKYLKTFTTRTFPVNRGIIGDESRGLVVSSVNPKNRWPKNFKSLKPEAQAFARRLSDADGEAIRITPNGGGAYTAFDSKGKAYVAGGRRKSRTSDHTTGLGLDALLNHKTPEQRMMWIARAIANGATSIGGYGPGVGSAQHTNHVGVRSKNMADPHGLTIWWWNSSSDKAGWRKGTAPAWFKEGIRRGRQMLDEQRGGSSA